MITIPVISESVERDVGVASAQNTLAMVTGKTYEFVGSTNAWVRQAGARRLTCSTKANATAGDYFTVNYDAQGKRAFQLDKTGADTALVAATISVTEVIRVDISGASTAAQVAALLAASIDTTMPAGVAVTDNTDGTIDLIADRQLATTEVCSNAAFLSAASTALVATAGSLSIYTPAGTARYLDGRDGQTVAVIRDSADGKSTLTRVRFKPAIG